MVWNVGILWVSPDNYGKHSTSQEWQFVEYIKEQPPSCLFIKVLILLADMNEARTSKILEWAEMEILDCQ